MLVCLNVLRFKRGWVSLLIKDPPPTSSTTWERNKLHVTRDMRQTGGSEHCLKISGP